MKRLLELATTDYLLHEVTALRQMTAEEREALTAYVEDRLELPSPPTFLACTTPGLQQAEMMAYHHSIVEGMLIADVTARVRLGKFIPRRSLLRE